MDLLRSTITPTPLHDFCALDERPIFEMKEPARDLLKSRRLLLRTAGELLTAAPRSDPLPVTESVGLMCVSAPHTQCFELFRARGRSLLHHSITFHLNFAHVSSSSSSSP